MSDNAIVLADEKNKLFPALVGWAEALSKLEPAQIPQALDMAIQFKKLGEDVYKNLRDKLLVAVKRDGEKVSEKGSMKASVGGYGVMAIPTKTGTDPGKLERRLRSLSMDPSAHMDARITYHVAPGKLSLLVEKGVITLEEVAYDPAFRVQVERE